MLSLAYTQNCKKIVDDFETAEQQAFQMYGKIRLSCHVHTLQFVVLSVLSEPKIAPAIDAAKKPAVKFHKHTAGEELKAVSGGKGVVMFVVTT